MINGAIKSKVDTMWDNLAAGGLTNPLEVIEQITYLMFIHDLDANDNKNAKHLYKKPLFPITLTYPSSNSRK